MKQFFLMNLVFMMVLAFTSTSFAFVEKKNKSEETPSFGQYVLSSNPDFSESAQKFSQPPIYGKVIFSNGKTADTLWRSPKVITISVDIDKKGFYNRKFSPSAEACQKGELEFPFAPPVGSSFKTEDTNHFIEALLKRAGNGVHEITLKMFGGENPNIGPFIITTFTLDLSNISVWQQYSEQIKKGAVSSRVAPAGINAPDLVNEFQAGLKGTSYQGALKVVVISRWEVIKGLKDTPIRKVMKGVLVYKEKGSSACMMRRADLYREYNGSTYEAPHLVIEGNFLPEEITCP